MTATKTTISTTAPISRKATISTTPIITTTAKYQQHFLLCYDQGVCWCDDCAVLEESSKCQLLSIFNSTSLSSSSLLLLVVNVDYSVLIVISIFEEVEQVHKHSTFHTPIINTSGKLKCNQHHEYLGVHNEFCSVFASLQKKMATIKTRPYKMNVAPDNSQK